MEQQNLSLTWRKATEVLQENVEHTLSLLKAEIFNWEHASADGLIQETHTLLNEDINKIDDTTPALSTSKDFVEGTQLKFPPELDGAFEAMGDLLEKMQQEEEQQELWLQNLERMVSELQHIERAVQSERDTLTRRHSQSELELETGPIWRTMYYNLKERYYEDIRRYFQDTEIQVTLQSNVPISFARPGPCQLPSEVIPGIGTRVKLAGRLAEIEPPLSAIRLQSLPEGPSDLRIGFHLRFQSPQTPETARLNTDSETLE